MSEKPPPPALLALGGANAKASGSLELTIGQATETDVALPITAVEAHDWAGATDSATATVIRATEAATNADWGLLLVPLGTSSFWFAIAVEYGGKSAARVSTVAIFLFTILAMRDENFSKLAKRLADQLKPPEK